MTDPNEDRAAIIAKLLQQPEMTPEQRAEFERQMAEVGRQWALIAEQLRIGFAAMVESMTETAEIIAKVRGLEQPPEDPRERALWMLQHRNHGPAQPPAGKARRRFRRS